LRFAERRHLVGSRVSVNSRYRDGSGDEKPIERAPNVTETEIGWPPFHAFDASTSPMDAVPRAAAAESKFRMFPS
jgi:hypothetical protein